MFVLSFSLYSQQFMVECYFISHFILLMRTAYLLLEYWFFYIHVYAFRLWRATVVSGIHTIWLNVGAFLLWTTPSASLCPAGQCPLYFFNTIYVICNMMIRHYTKWYDLSQYVVGLHEKNINSLQSLAPLTVIALPKYLNNLYFL